MARNLIGWNIQIGRIPHMLRKRDILRHSAFRKDFETELNGDRCLFASRIEMQIEIDLRTGLDEPPGVRRKDVAVLAQRIFVEEQTNGIVFGIFNEIRREVMNDFETAGKNGDIFPPNSGRLV